MNITDELMRADDATFTASLATVVAASIAVAKNEYEIEQSVRQQFRENIAGEETSEETRQMLEQKYGLAPVKFTRVEEKVIRKQSRKDARVMEADYATA